MLIASVSPVARSMGFILHSMFFIAKPPQMTLFSARSAVNPAVAAGHFYTGLRTYTKTRLVRTLALL